MDKNKSIYVPLTDEQVNKFVYEKSINHLDHIHTKQFTVILCENGNQQGYYMVYKNEENKTSSQYVSEEINEVNKDPLSIGGMATGESFLTIIINHEGLVKNADHITVTLDNEEIISNNIKTKGKVIYIGENKKWRQIKIYNTNNDLIYEYIRP